MLVSVWLSFHKLAHNYQPSAIDYQLLTISYRPPAIDHQPQATNHKPNVPGRPFSYSPKLFGLQVLSGLHSSA
jgi:hypothetical protein